MINPTIVRLRRHFAALDSPVVVFNKSHSGSRLLAGLLAGQGIFMGSALNESQDALPIVPLMESLVRHYYPDYGRLWGVEPWPGGLEELAVAAFERHLAGRDPRRHRAWGWKLCETGFILPVIDAIFPSARYVHLVRDGRDVAFSDHVAPEQPLWRKIYFNTDKIDQWRGLPLSHRAYERSSHIYNALHWVNSVEVCRTYGAMLRERYVEVRYEDLCTRFADTAENLLAFLDCRPDPQALDAVARKVVTGRIGKFRYQPPAKQEEVLQLIEPTMLAMGYAVTPRGRDAGAGLSAFRHGWVDHIRRIGSSRRA
ncbi:MAG TPA: sulfotransferase [Xanthobacteraceae bacterium]